MAKLPELPHSRVEQASIAPSHRIVGSRSPAIAARTTWRPTNSATGSVRSVTFSFPSALENAVVIASSVSACAGFWRHSAGVLIVAPSGIKCYRHAETLARWNSSMLPSRTEPAAIRHLKR
jgi:hypothetical protein